MNRNLPSFAGLTLLLTLLSGCAAPLARGSAGGAGMRPLAAAPAELRADIVPSPVSFEPAEQPAPVEAPVVAMPRECPKEGLRVMLIGDSLSAGLGPVMAKHAKACGTYFHHKGVVGSHVTEWASDNWLMPELMHARPDVVIISMGGNDFGRRDPHNVQKGIEMVVSKVRATGAKLLWISPPTMEFADRVGARAMWQDALGGSVNVDRYPTEELTIPRTTDRIHPTPAGYRDLGKSLWQWMSTVSS